jgi:hypothetical protein
MNKFSGFILLAISFVFAMGFVLAQPNGASTITSVSNSSGASTAPTSHAAIAGNVSEITITGVSNSQSWQGFFGNVSGGIRLANAAGNVLYNWSLASPQGEVFASNDSSVAWTNLFCFNATGNGTSLEAQYGIDSTDIDGVNETFLETVAHDAFTVGSTSFIANQCPAAFMFDSTGQGVDNSFEEVLLTDASYNEHVIYTAILEQNVLGFDGTQNDFQMIVLENGHLGDTSTTSYYFYVELE